MNRKTNLLVLLAAAAVTVLTVAGLSDAASQAPPTNTSPPTISGTATEGNTLTASSGTWNGQGPITYSFQWRRCDENGNSCAAISGANKANYVLKKVDVGNTLRVREAAKNKDGTTSADSVPTAVVKAAAGPPPVSVNGCPTVTTGTLDVAALSPPARLLIDGQQVSPSVISRSTSDVTVRFHVSACNGRSVQNALILAEAIPFQQFSIPAETATGSDGWATMIMHRGSAFPASPRQQILAVFVRARKSGENILGGISTRRLVSFPVHL
jgi:hypothetical protein